MADKDRADMARYREVQGHGRGPNRVRAGCYLPAARKFFGQNFGASQFAGGVTVQP